MSFAEVQTQFKFDNSRPGPKDTDFWCACVIHHYRCSDYMIQGALTYSGQCER